MSRLPVLISLLSWLARSYLKYLAPLHACPQLPPPAILRFSKANLIDRHCGSNLALVGVQHKKCVGGGLAGYWDQLNILAILPPAIGVFYSTLDFLHHVRNKPRTKCSKLTFIVNFLLSLHN